MNGSTPHVNFEERLRRRRRTIRSFESKFNKLRSPLEKLSDSITAFCGTIEFWLINLVWFSLWIFLNGKIVPGLVPFDPFPFGFLTVLVSLEAIFLSIFVLITQNRQARIADLREEIELQVSLIAEDEITKTMRLVAGLYKELKLKLPEDKELEEMMTPLDTAAIERKLESDLQGETVIQSLKEMIGQTVKK